MVSTLNLIKKSSNILVKLDHVQRITKVTYTNHVFRELPTQTESLSFFQPSNTEMTVLYLHVRCLEKVPNRFSQLVVWMVISSHGRIRKNTNKNKSKRINNPNMVDSDFPAKHQPVDRGSIFLQILAAALHPGMRIVTHHRCSEPSTRRCSGHDPF